MFPKFDVFGCSPLLCIWGVDSCKGTQTEFVRVANFWWVWHEAQAKKEILHRKQYHAINMMPFFCNCQTNFLIICSKTKETLYSTVKLSAVKLDEYSKVRKWKFVTLPKSPQKSGLEWNGEWISLRGKVSSVTKKSFVWFVENSSKANTQGEVGIDLGNL